MIDALGIIRFFNVLKHFGPVLWWGMNLVAVSVDQFLVGQMASSFSAYFTLVC